MNERNAVTLPIGLSVSLCDTKRPIESLDAKSIIVARPLLYPNTYQNYRGAAVKVPGCISIPVINNKFGAVGMFDRTDVRGWCYEP